MDIYLDTNLWNALYDQNVVPAEFVGRLSEEGAHLSPGIHIFYELAKTFRSVKPTGQARATIFQKLHRT